MKAVIDTNVLLVANGMHDDVSNDCAEECIRRLVSMLKSGITVIDDNFLILNEYMKKTDSKQPQGVGDVFLKFLLQNRTNSAKVALVSLKEISPDCFAEFPDPELERVFDASDRKFVAVAHAHPDKPPIWQAADCKWLDWWPALKAKGVRIEFLCRDDVSKFYCKKFPDKRPELPD